MKRHHNLFFTALLFALITLLIVPAVTAAPGAFNLLTPGSSTTVEIRRPDFSWQSAPRAKRYTLQVRNAANKAVINRNYTAAQANCQNGGTCTITAPKNLANGNYRWRVIARGGGKTVSPFTNITVQVVAQNPPPAPNNYAQQMLDLVNRRRCNQGLAPLTLNTSLTNAAQNHSSRMASLNFFNHTDPNNNSTHITRARAAGYPSNFIGENISAGQSTANDAFLAWWRSAGHKANILNPNYREMGLGYVYNANSTYGYYWTQVFGSRTGAPAGTCP